MWALKNNLAETPTELQTLCGGTHRQGLVRSNETLEMTFKVKVWCWLHLKQGHTVKGAWRFKNNRLLLRGCDTQPEVYS